MEIMSILQLLEKPAQELLWAFKLFFEIYLLALAALFALCLSKKTLLYWTISKRLMQKKKGR